MSAFILLSLTAFVLVATARTIFPFWEKGENSPCLTNEGQPGKCFPITACRKNFKHLLDESQRPKLCSWNGDIPIVCCPSKVDNNNNKRMTTTKGTILTTTTTTTPRKTIHEEGILWPNPRKRLPKSSSKVKCGTRRPKGPTLYVVGGTPTSQRAWPWMVSLKRKSFDGSSADHFCGGSIISERLILTAAHCLAGLETSPDEILVESGSSGDLSGDFSQENNNNKTDTLNFQILETIVHPKYRRGSHYFDIGLVKLKESISFSDHIRPICLPFSSPLSLSSSQPKMLKMPRVGEEVEIAGWGQLSFGGLESRVLQEATLRLMSIKECNVSYVKLNSSRLKNGLNADFYCAGTADGSKDSCQGDSGGPLTYKLDTKLEDLSGVSGDNFDEDNENDDNEEGMEEGDENYERTYFLVGIVSFGYQCAVKGYPGVYTKVSSYLNWLKGYL